MNQPQRQLGTIRGRGGQGVLAENGLAIADSDKARAAEALKAKINEVLGSEDHRWYTGNMDPEEAARRAKAGEDLKQRYEKK